MVPTATSLPSRISFARFTSAGRTQTLATSYCARAGSRVLDERVVELGPQEAVVDRLGDVALGQRVEQCASLGAGACVNGVPIGLTRPVERGAALAIPVILDRPSVAVGPENVASDQKALLDLLVAPLEPTVLVFDDAIALVSLPVQLRVDHAPVDLTEAGDARDLPAHAHRHDSALVQPVAVDHQVLGLVVKDVLAEFLEEPADVDHLEDQVARVEVEPHRVRPRLEDPAPHARRGGDVMAARPLVVREEHRAVLGR